MKIRYFLVFISFLLSMSICAQLRPALHVDGVQLRDEAGNNVVLHGISDSPNPSCNKLYWGIVVKDDSIGACISYFNRLFTAVTDSSQGCYANVFRLHLDPVWTNNPNLVSDGVYLGEADISCFSASSLKNYMKSLYWKIIEKALSHGLYVVVRPPGVCQSSISVNGDYQDYLLDVWDIVSKNDSIKKYSGQI